MKNSENRLLLINIKNDIFKNVKKLKNYPKILKHQKFNKFKNLFKETWNKILKTDYSEN